MLFEQVAYIALQQKIEIKCLVFTMFVNGRFQSVL